MDEPTLAEEVRRLGDEVRRLADGQAAYVTKEIMQLKLEALAKDQADLEKAQAATEARLASVTRWFWTVVAGPAIVGIILYVTLGKTP